MTARRKRVSHIAVQFWLKRQIGKVNKRTFDFFAKRILASTPKQLLQKTNSQLRFCNNYGMIRQYFVVLIDKNIFK